MEKMVKVEKPMTRYYMRGKELIVENVNVLRTSNLKEGIQCH